MLANEIEKILTIKEPIVIAIEVTPKKIAKIMHLAKFVI